MQRALQALTFLPLLLFLACGVSQTYYKRIDTRLRDYDFQGALGKLDQEEYGSRNRLLYHLDKGILAHYQGDFAASNAELGKADELAEDLFTKSVSQRVSSYVTNDNVRDYPGEDFEVALIDLFRTVNYLLLGELENALVMCRRVDHKLKVYSDKYEAENAKQREAGEKVVVAYTEDAFIRYLMGLLFEEGGEVDNAFVALRNALRIYEDYQKLYGTPLPGILVQDLIRVGTKLGYTEEVEQYRSRFPSLVTGAEPLQPGQAQVTFLFYNGLAPVKEELAIDLNINNANAPLVEVSVPGYQPSHLDPMGIRIALPYYKKRPPSAHFSELILSAEGGRHFARSQLVEDITEIAVRNLKDRLPSIRRRTLVRVIIKAVASRVVDKQAKKNLGLAGVLLGAGTMVAAKYSEQADLRCWRTLPAQVQMARLTVPAGTYDYSVLLSNGWGRQLGKLELKPGQHRFLAYQSIN